MTTTDTAARVADALQRGAANLQGRGSNVNEATTRSVLIDAVLDALGYPPTHRTPEESLRDNIPDYLCFLNEVTTQTGYADLIVEAKKLGTSFDQVPSGQARATSPDRQIQRYLRDFERSGEDTLGVLTDGIRWRVYRRGPTPSDIDYDKRFDFSGIASSSQDDLDSAAARIDEFIELLSSKAIAGQLRPDVRRRTNLADRLFTAIQNVDTPEQVVKEILNEPNAVVSDRLENADSLTGIRKDAHQKDWETHAVALGPSLKADQLPLEDARVHVAAVKFEPVDNRDMSRGDVALFARTVASSNPANSSVILAYETAPDGSMTARMAVAAAGQVNMTAPFDPALPSPSARSSIDQQLRLIRDTSGPLNADRLLLPLAVANLRQQFYKEVAAWTERIQRGKKQEAREAVLRHLIRVMFAWILKEENRIPAELFERAFIEQALDKSVDDYHDSVLRFLFHRRLNVRRDQRDKHDIDTLNEALDRAPFLNGSLFAKQQGDDAFSLRSDDYWASKEDADGLFTILKRYHWTMDEHRPGESEQTLDPELLSNLFERLIASTELGGEKVILRQPKGTYYTPADVVDEMVKDALSAAVKDHAGALTDTQLLDLFDDPDFELPEDMDNDQKRLLAERIRELRIFDPAVGSGAFLFSILHAIRRSLWKLENIEEPAEDIIKRQLRGQDISPLAVQIARLRLFIAITAARKDSELGGLSGGDEALPNLEAVIVCADTLKTIVDPEFLPEQAWPEMAYADIASAVNEVTANRTRWFEVHSDVEKNNVLNTDTLLRSRLEGLLKSRGELASPELEAFTQAGLMSHGPANTDSRLLFYENPWRGFDIVIGNPPYEALSNSMTPAQRKALADDKGYRTVRGGDLYNLFCETALALANPEGGVVTFIVPLSIAFGQDKQSLRNVFMERSASINLRHYDIRPNTLFNSSPTVLNPENSQRATILTAILHPASKPQILTTGLQRWPADKRQECLRERQYVPLSPAKPTFDRRISGQWLRVPTKEAADLVDRITLQSQTVLSFRQKDGDGPNLAFADVPRYFLSAIPVGSVEPRTETLFQLENWDALYLLMAALNGHVGYGWWSMVGDGFHLKAVSDLGFFTIPNAWFKNPNGAIELGKKLVNAIPECTTEELNRGKVRLNVNFHLRPDLIEELDHLHIEALGLPVEPLLTHLKIMRSSSSWDYSRTV